MHDYRIDADIFHQDHIQGEIAFQLFIDHGVAAILDNNSFVIKFTNIRQRLNEHLGLGNTFFHFPLRSGADYTNIDIQIIYITLAADSCKQFSSPLWGENILLYALYISHGSK
jgi:hypothetical protein